MVALLLREVSSGTLEWIFSLIYHDHRDVSRLRWNNAV